MTASARPGRRACLIGFASALSVASAACWEDEPPPGVWPPPPATVAVRGPSPVGTGAPSATETATRADAKRSSGCPANMVIVEGDYCPNVKQQCKQHMADYEQEKRARELKRKLGQIVPPRRVPERCLVYEQPSKCLSKKRVPMRFCVDRYEWPNEVGKKPEFLVTWKYAEQQCLAIGKRLCSGDEFNFACEGESMLPYSAGYERDAKNCNMDKPYVWPRFALMPYDRCMESKRCSEHLDELDQRTPIGDNPKCTSPFGAFDLNGNVNEWVARGKMKAPWRSGLKGGWWGPARSRCRPMVTAHDENYSGYEVGFRCCKDAQAADSVNDSEEI